MCSSLKFDLNDICFLQFTYNYLSRAMCVQNSVPLLATCLKASPNKQQVSPDVVFQYDNKAMACDDVVTPKLPASPRRYETKRDDDLHVDDAGSSIAVLARLSRQMALAAGRDQGDGGSDRNMKMWQEVSLVFDRMFFWIYMLVILVCCVAVFLVYFT